MKPGRPESDVTCVPRTRTLGGIMAHAMCDGAVRKSDLACGDRVIVRTRNSTYRLLALGDGTFVVSGGWFDRQSPGIKTLAVNGCTYGGSVIRTDIVAARGLFMEFENRVSTTRIRDVRVVRASCLPAA